MSNLKAKAHSLDPTAHIGKNGLTNEAVAHIDRALDDHELIKVKFQAMKDEKERLAASLAERTGAELVEIIGNIAVLYRRNEAESGRRVAPA